MATDKEVTQLIDPQLLDSATMLQCWCGHSYYNHPQIWKDDRMRPCEKECTCKNYDSNYTLAKVRGSQRNEFLMKLNEAS